MHFVWPLIQVSSHVMSCHVIYSHMPGPEVLWHAYLHELFGLQHSQYNEVRTQLSEHECILEI